MIEVKGIETNSNLGAGAVRDVSSCPNAGAAGKAAAGLTMAASAGTSEVILQVADWMWSVVVLTLGTRRRGRSSRSSVLAAHFGEARHAELRLYHSLEE